MNKAINRNVKRFPGGNFMFQLTEDESKNLKFQNGTPSSIYLSLFQLSQPSTHTMNNRIKPLYRKENKVSLSNKYNVSTGSEYRYERRSKAFLNDDSNHKSMTSGKYGYDYTPLFKFLLSKVGSDWDKIYAEAKARLNDPAPIFWIVALHDSERRNIVRVGESTYYSGLFVNDDGILAIVNPNISSSELPEPYPGETISFNGIVMDISGTPITETIADGTVQNDTGKDQI